MKYFAYIMIAMLLFSTVEADAKGNNHNHNAAQQKAAKAAQKKREKEHKEREEKNKLIMNYLQGVDTNHDGSVSRDEFLAPESNKEKALKMFDAANKNRDSSLTKSEIADMLGVK